MKRTLLITNANSGLDDTTVVLTDGGYSDDALPISCLAALSSVRFMWMAS